ncbi:MAG: CPBP family glutamic-type intramembrane protease [Conexivisphaerales archaeon]
MLKEKRRFEDMLLYSVAAVSVIVLAFMFASFALGAYAFTSPMLGGTSVRQTTQYLPIFAFGIAVPIFFPFPLTIGEIFVAVWAIYLTFFVILLMGPWSGLLNSLKKIKQDRTLAIYSNGALTVAVAFPAILILAAAIEFLLNSVGIPVGSLSQQDPRGFFYQLSIAPLIEEFGFRLCFVGLAAFLISWGVTKSYHSLRAFWHPSNALSEAGIQTWRQAPLYLSIALSALIFGFAHYLYGGGWEVGKIVSATIVGLFLAIIYYTHGFPAAVISHWGFDYFQAAFLYFDDVRGLPDISNVSNFSQALLYSQTYETYLMVFSAFVIYAYFIYTIIQGRLHNRSAFKHRE